MVQNSPTLMFLKNFNNLDGENQNLLDTQIFWDFATNILWKFQKMIFEKLDNIEITLILRSQQTKYFGRWTWKTLHFENQSFRKDRPQKFRLKYQGARDVILRKLIFSSRSPPINCVLNISTSPPTARSAEIFYIFWNVSYHVNVFSLSGSGHFSEHRPQARAARNLFLKCHWTIIHFSFRWRFSSTLSPICTTHHWSYYFVCQSEFTHWSQ